ncbi:hypothetical protein AAZX31_06G190700 [Glycine max]
MSSLTTVILIQTSAYISGEQSREFSTGFCRASALKPSNPLSLIFVVYTSLLPWCNYIFFISRTKLIHKITVFLERD